MKKLLEIDESNIIYVISVVLSVLIIFMTVQPVFAESTIQSQACYESHRGTRCKITLTDERVAIQAYVEAFQGLEVCAKSARGTRCQSHNDNPIIADSFETQSFPVRTQCMTAVRGTRHCDIES